jgi:ABC-type transport system substrate-binding protein
VGKEFVAPQPCYEYSPPKAKELLVQAGHPNGFEMEIWTSSGRYTKDREIGEATQAMLNSVGIRARLRTMEWAAYTKGWTAPDRMMWMIGRSTGFADFIFTRHFARASWDSGANNNTRFFDPRVEDLLVRARQEMDVKRRAAYYREIQELVWQAVPIIPLYTAKVVVLTRANITGLVVQPDEELGMALVKRRP